MFVKWGFNPEITAVFAMLLFQQYKAIMTLAWYRYKMSVQLKHRRLTPGEQYRIHIRNGGFRC